VARGVELPAPDAELSQDREPRIASATTWWSRARRRVPEEVGLRVRRPEDAKPPVGPQQRLRAAGSRGRDFSVLGAASACSSLLLVIRRSSPAPGRRRRDAEPRARRGEPP